MSSQDQLERVLRDIHVMISKSESYGGSKIILDKQELFEHIDRLNTSIYDVMEEYELTKQSRDAGEREHRKRADRIVWDASRKAEDIYAASLMYTDESLSHIEDIIKDAADRIRTLGDSMVSDMEAQRHIIRENQLELKGQMQDLLDTEKYLSLIEERNKEIEKEKLLAGSRYAPAAQEKSQFADIKAEVIVNKELLRTAGYEVEDDEEEKKEPQEEKKTTQSQPKPKSSFDEMAELFRHEEQQADDDDEIKIPSEDLDAEYFAWKDGQD